MRAIQLKAEFRHNPMGIDNPAPLFSWKCEGGIKQTAYQVQARDDDGVLLFDSGKVATDIMRVTYKGKPLHSGQRTHWNVRLWDEKNNTDVSETAVFEMGLLNPSDWQARWICGIDTDKAERLPADYYRKTFTLSKPVKQARLYATACGLYTAMVNGNRVSGVLTPGCTQYDKRLYYQTYDIEGLIIGENSLECIVGDGWFKGKLGNDNVEYMFGTQLKLLAQLSIVYEDGTREVIGTDSSFLWCNDGPICYSDMKDGEVFDARRIPSYSANARETEYSVQPSAAIQNGLDEHERFTPKLYISPSGAKILDFGQNMAGYIRFRPTGKPGDTVTIKMFETLDKV